MKNARNHLCFLRLCMASLLPVMGLMAHMPAWAGPVLDRVTSSGQLRVCIWPDYYGITFRSPKTQQLSGIDIDLSAAFAKDLGATLVYVDSSFVKLVEQLKTDRCDIAMHAVGVTAQRQQSLAFSIPYLQSDIYGVTTRNSRVIRKWADIDQEGVQVAVQAGTFMEPVMAASLKRAKMVTIKPPQTREEELESGRVDVFMTDYPYSRRLLDNADWAKLISPDRSFFPLPYAYACKQGDDAWVARINQFVERIKRDGTLAAAAKRHGLSEIVLKN